MIQEILIPLHKEALIKLEAIHKEMATEKSPQRMLAVEKLAAQYAEVMEKILNATTVFTGKGNGV